MLVACLVDLFFFSSRRRHTRCALVTGVQTCALPICNRLFELGLSPVALALCGTSDPASQKRIDAILAEHRSESFAVRFLQSADLKWAAELLADLDRKSTRLNSSH